MTPDRGLAQGEFEKMINSLLKIQEKKDKPVDWPFRFDFVK